MKHQPHRWDFPALDGLRGVAILLVVWCHLCAFGLAAGLNTGPRLLQVAASLGGSGVVLFFVLSGFLLFLPYARALLHGGPWPSTRQFYRRRALRILPAYLFVFACLLAFSAHYSLQPTQRGPLALLAVLLQDLDPASFNLGSLLDAPLWSLTVEWQFYLLLPLLALALARLSGPAGRRYTLVRLSMGLGALIFLGLGIRWLVVELHYAAGYPLASSAPGWLGLSMRFLYGMRGKFLEVFALGMLVSALYVGLIESGRIPGHLRRRLLAWSTALALVGGLACFLWLDVSQPELFLKPADWLFPPNGQIMLALSSWVQGVCYALLLLSALLGSQGLTWVLTHAPLRWIGRISYSMYLWHYLLISILISWFIPRQPFAYLRFSLLALLIIISWSAASYWVVERPFLRWRRVSQKPMKPSAVIADTPAGSS